MVYLHLIFSSWVPRVRSTRVARTSLKESPLEDEDPLIYPVELLDEVAGVVVSKAFEESELVTLP